MSKHTPGPWSLNIEDGRAEVCVDGERLTDPYIGDENARLIAAAPDLLAMLKVAQIWLDVDGRFDMQGINAAIAKAEGRS